MSYDSMRRDKLLVAILCWTALAFGVQFWLPFVRSLTQGDAYPWGLGWGIHGNGLHGDFWALIVGVSLRRHGFAMSHTSLLRHFLAALAYRTQKALRGAPVDFDSFSAGEQ